jgi:hypothetical protein
MLLADVLEEVAPNVLDYMIALVERSHQTSDCSSYDPTIPLLSIGFLFARIFKR